MMKPPITEPCPSETSTVVSVSEPPLIRKLKVSMERQEEDEENHEEDAKVDLVLDLSLPNTDSDQGSKPELNFIDCFDTTSSETSPPQAEPGRVFSCNYCQRKFYSSQALGGHQNAHKRERTLAKRSSSSSSTGQRFGTTASFMLPSSSFPYRYSSMASLPLHGSFNRSLGIQVHSMIHKPSLLHHHYQPSSGHHGWQISRLPLDQQPAIGRLEPETFLGPREATGVFSSSSSSTGGPASRFEAVRRFSPASTDRDHQEVGGFWWNSTDTSSTVGHMKTKQDELQKLDLSLKL